MIIVISITKINIIVTILCSFFVCTFFNNNNYILIWEMKCVILFSVGYQSRLSIEICPLFKC